MPVEDTLAPWEHFLTEVDEGDGERSLCLTLLNTGFMRPENRAGLPWLLRVIVDYQPDDRGMPGVEARASIQELQDEIEGEIDRHGAVMVGTLTGGGRWGAFWYSPRRPKFDEDILIALRPHVAVREGLADRDPDWTLYTQVLLPDPAGLEALSNRKVREGLAEDGDDGRAPRPVDHVLDFRDQAGMDEVTAWASAQGYRVKAIGPLRLQVTVVQAVAGEAFDAACYGWRVRAEAVGGDYDGWGCPVTLSDQAP